MARCKLTNMNLRNIRKTREYQCLLIDLVKTGVVDKSAAEGLLGYTIPAGLLEGAVPVIEKGEPVIEEEEPRLITIVASVTDDSPKPLPFYDSFTYDLNNGDTIEDVLDAANEHWGGSHGFNNVVELYEDPRGQVIVNGTYYSGTNSIEVLETGMIVEVNHLDIEQQDQYPRSEEED